MTPAPMAASAALRGPGGVPQGTAQAAPHGHAEEAKFCRTTTVPCQAGRGTLSKSLFPLKRGLVCEWQQMEGVRPPRLLSSAMNY